MKNNKSSKNNDEKSNIKKKISKKKRASDDDSDDEKKERSLKYFPEILYRRASLGYLKGVLDPDFEIGCMKISENKSAAEYIIDMNNNIATLQGGYRVCRCTFGFNYGFLRRDEENKFYWECEFLEDDHIDSHIRIGIATRKANIDMPIAADEFGYCIRDLGGAYFNRNMIKNTPSFNKGDTVGLGIEILPENSKLHFWINGEYMGVIFDDIPSLRTWFPALSCYKGASVRMSFAKFKYPQKDWIPSIKSPIVRREYKWTITEFEKFLKKFNVNRIPKDAFEVISQALIPYPDLPR